MGCKAGRGMDQWETGVTRKTGCYWLHRRIQLVSRALIGSVPHFFLSGFLKYQTTKFLLGLGFQNFERIEGEDEVSLGFWLLDDKF
jgi:hypothetical protein